MILSVMKIGHLCRSQTLLLRGRKHSCPSLVPRITLQHILALRDQSFGAICSARRCQRGWSELKSTKSPAAVATANCLPLGKNATARGGALSENDAKGFSGFSGPSSRQ